MAASVSRTFGFGLIDLTEMSEDSLTLRTVKRFFSRTWPLKFGRSDRPVDDYTRGFLAVANAVIFDCPLAQVQVAQTLCMACGDACNTHVVQPGPNHFALYPSKQATRFGASPQSPGPWAAQALITQAFLDAHEHLVGNEEGCIPAFGVDLACNQSDYIKRLPFEFVRALRDVAGEYGGKPGTELLLESGHACGFFTCAGAMSSEKWRTVVQPHLHSREDWMASWKSRSRFEHAEHAPGKGI
jgi:hypothetical protein